MTSDENSGTISDDSIDTPVKNQQFVNLLAMAITKNESYLTSQMRSVHQHFQQKIIPRKTFEFAQLSNYIFLQSVPTSQVPDSNKTELGFCRFPAFDPAYILLRVLIASLNYVRELGGGHVS